jgi:flagellar assembly protein FliH
MKNYSRFIPGEEIGDVEQWHFGAVGVAAENKGSKQEILNAKMALLANSVVRQEGHSDGYAEGFAQGHAQAVLETQKQITDYIENEGRDLAQRFGQLLTSVQVQLTLSEGVLSHGVLSLACEIARNILKREISVNSEAVMPIISQGLTLLMDGGKNAKIKLNPLDFEELKDRLSEEFSEISLTLVADPAIACGGCLIESQDTIVDGTIDKRWSRTIASLGLHADWTVTDEP